MTISETGGAGKRTWFTSAWFLVSLGVMASLTVASAIAAESSLEYMAGQLVLFLSVGLSLYVLSDQPLINPLQIVVGLFYWWFGVGPVVTSAFYLLAGAPGRAAQAQEAGRESLWIVSLGLPLYAVAARGVLRRLKARKSFAGFLMPSGTLFRPSTLLIYGVIGLSAKAAVLAFGAMGFHGITTVNFLGGTQTDIWWLGVLNSIGDVSTFATVGIMSSLAAPRRMSPPWLKGLGLLLILQTLAIALTSGWKSAFVIIFFYVVCARMSFTQRIPWFIGLAVLLGFLFVVEPFVSLARTQAQTAGAETPADRQEVFREALKSGALTAAPDWREIRMESLFRGIYPLAGQLARSGSLFSGRWDGKTILWGFQILMPRALMPEKPPSDIGNFFARTVGVDAGVSTPDNYDFNVALSLPFEFVGNFGWLAGVLSFPLLGLFWGGLCGWALSASRLSQHPFSPLFCFLAVTMESPFGNFLAGLRGYLIPLLVLWLIAVLRRRQL